ALAGGRATAGAGGAATGGLPAGLDDMAPPPAVLSEAPQTLYLDVMIDGQLVRPLVRFHRADGRLWVAPGELDAAGLQLPPGLPTDAEGRIALDSVPGLGVRFQGSLQRVLLAPPPGMRRAVRLGYRRPEAVAVDRDAGLLLDWDAYGRRYRDSDTFSLGTALRWFGRYGALELSGVSRAGDGADDAYARLDTRWTWSDPQRMWTWTAGDFISGGLNWTRPLRLGGLQWRRNFATRPDLIVYPVPQFSADPTVPSSVELYVNNVRQYQGEVDPGPFVLSDFPRVTGAGEAVVVVTDALGRTTQTSVPLYVDYQRLARGLSDFSLEAGLLRRHYGSRSDDYGDDPVASASWRYGLRDALTVELHGEAGGGLRLAGGGLAWSPLGRYGVVTAAYARSELARDAGYQYAIGYQWFGQRAGFDLYRQRASAGFRDLGALEAGSLPLREQDRASLWFGVPRGSLSLSWLRYRDHAEPASRTVSLGLGQSWRRLSYSVGVFDDSRAGHGVSLSLSLPLGEAVDASLSLDRDGGDTRAAAALRRNAPYAGGWGWTAQARDDGDGQLGAHYRGSAGEAWFGVDRSGGHGGAFAQGYGSVVWMDGQGFLSRAVSDAFAVVSTNGVADVPILFENRVAGHTDENGYLLLPELRGWQRNRVAIDPDGLPPDLDVPAIERMVVPAERSGVRVEFALAPLRSTTLVLRDAQGRPVEPGVRVRRGDGSEAIVGFDGELWLERYVEGETLSWTRAGLRCAAVAPARADAGPGPARCEAEATP
ncbi:fimbria/pilus outer membrane usher protein, partial [Vulcaniibacterium tengchongense]